ncbi:putative uncharacterized protein [Parachlamydia acanthamoebae UV-7]|uniref:Uncharacterized protein n=2 Tax=Parachlamydia acanthamoebae TaxID=83552 RepID=F8KYV3_PARAV|nr:hypothetical protein [Parachlamydia acanthamoebae]KIA78217.1 hypothetical protein DB43_EL00280 [Parachlamydia acanthamoebae]CCB86067.1 putative uncharacterized protein [Parachlamydia acanthamoebae UV-7]
MKIIGTGSFQEVVESNIEKIQKGKWYSNQRFKVVQNLSNSDQFSVVKIHIFQRFLIKIPFFRSLVTKKMPGKVTFLSSSQIKQRMHFKGHSFKNLKNAEKLQVVIAGLDGELRNQLNSINDLKSLSSQLNIFLKNTTHQKTLYQNASSDLFILNPSEIKFSMDLTEAVLRWMVLNHYIVGFDRQPHLFAIYKTDSAHSPSALMHEQSIMNIYAHMKQMENLQAKSDFSKEQKVFFEQLYDEVRLLHYQNFLSKKDQVTELKISHEFYSKDQAQVFDYFVESNCMHAWLSKEVFYIKLTASAHIPPQFEEEVWGCKWRDLRLIQMEKKIGRNPKTLSKNLIFDEDHIIYAQRILKKINQRKQIGVITWVVGHQTNAIMLKNVLNQLKDAKIIHHYTKKDFIFYIFAEQEDQIIHFQTKHFLKIFPKDIRESKLNFDEQKQLQQLITQLNQRTGPGEVEWSGSANVIAFLNAYGIKTQTVEDKYLIFRNKCDLVAKFRKENSVSWNSDLLNEIALNKEPYISGLKDLVSCLNARKKSGPIRWKGLENNLSDTVDLLSKLVSKDLIYKFSWKDDLDIPLDYITIIHKKSDLFA